MSYADALERLEQQAKKNLKRVYMGKSHTQALDHYGAPMPGYTKTPNPNSPQAQMEADMRAGWEKILGNSQGDAATGGRPDMTQFVTLNGSKPQLDTGGYENAMAQWLRGQDRYADWSDEDIASFVRDTAGVDANQRAAMEMWYSNRIASEQAATDAEADRNDMLAKLEAYEQGYNEEWISSTLAREKMLWDVRRDSTLRRVQEQMSNMGRSASPYMLAEINRRLVAQQSDALQVRRFELEQERDARKRWILEMKNNIYQNTQRQVMDPATAADLVARLGQASADA